MQHKDYFKDKKITVLGLGLLGRGVGDVEFLAQSGANLIVTDLKPSTQLRPSLQKLRKFKNIKYVLGKHRLEDFKGRDMILKSASVPLDSPYIKEAKKNKIPVEMSAALVTRLSPAKIIGITGTRGKSTVTQMIYEILQQGLSLLGVTPVAKIFLGGNVRGIATLPLLKKAKKGDIIVMELDSWQLQGFGESKISPHIAVFTNLLRDHMNYYKGSMSKYFQDKANIYKYQKKGDYLIAGKEITKKIKAKKIVPKALPNPPAGGWKLKIAGEHNRENAALALEAAKKVGVSERVVKKVLENFKSVEGRLEYMKTVKGVKIYNDNNATTPDATIMALKALGSKKKNIVLIMGGADKGLDMIKLLKEIKKYCKTVVLLSGTGTDKLKTIWLSDSQIVDNLKDAVKLAIQESKKDDIILFSPAFASFGLFKNEYDRNDQFVGIIKKLK
ncbi:MAG: UDP-N-acetylmuramoyl-L-alanine--D-glutamate ligase [Parcubacteria group bacterium]|nr:UDP-N-acetylmuramoyl-L-alanine--D-glutamate ligase [Parcubacteria group bacterium]